MKLTRGQFIGICMAGTVFSPCRNIESAYNENTLYKAQHFVSLPEDNVKCLLCPRNCEIGNNQRGHCEVRENRGGILYSLVYGYPCTIHPYDPIQKKPFFHVYPGSTTFSIATVGCNIDCKFCQNWEIAQARPEDISARYIPPEKIAEMALDSKAKTVAYTYTEPTIFFEYMKDCVIAVKNKGLGNIVVSNGFISRKPLEELCKIVTAIKVDLKAFTQKFYSEMCNGYLQPVLDSLKIIKDNGTWLEIVVLLIPDQNDNYDEIKKMIEWMIKNLGNDVPVHFTRYHPAYKIQNIPPTPIQTLITARKIAMEQGCHYVYIGNIPGGEGARTYCPSCKAIVLDRYMNLVVSDSLRNGKCPACGTTIPGIWS